MSRPRFTFDLPRIVGIDDLSDRQREVLDCRCIAGLTNQEAAERLHIQPVTVKSHITTLRHRLGMMSMYQVCFEYGRMYSVPGYRADQV